MELLTKEQMAALLEGRQYGEEITKEEEAQAKASGLVVIFGYSDDNIELRGAIHDEVGAWEGCDIYLYRDKDAGVLILDDPDNEDCEKCAARLKILQPQCAEIKCQWGKGDYAWPMECAIPFASFEIVEGTEKFCRGIVINTKDLPLL